MLCDPSDLLSHVLLRVAHSSDMAILALQAGAHILANSLNIILLKVHKSYKRRLIAHNSQHLWDCGSNIYTL